MVKSDIMASYIDPQDAINPQNIIESLPFAIYSCDLAGYITQYNQAAVQLWGREPEIGKDLWCGSWRIYKPDHSEMPLDECPMAVVLKEGHEVNGEEIIVQRPDNSLRNVMPYPKPLFDTDGKLIGAINMLVDITDQKQRDEKAAHFAAIVASSDDAIISKTLDGIVTSWNISAERIFGWTAEEMIGRSITTIIPEDRLNEEPVIISHLKRGERIDHFETKRIAKDGKILDVSLTISLVKSSDGKIIGASKIARNITAQKQSERTIREGEERFRMAVESTKLGTWEYFPLTGELGWSKECKKIYGIPPHMQVDYSVFSKYIYPEDADYVQKQIEKCLDPASDGAYDIQFRIIRYDDYKVRWVRSQGKVYFNDKAQAERFIGTVLDITEEKAVKEELEKVVDERTKELKNLNIALETSNKELEQFAYVASHDLQEPLRKINAFGDILKNKYQQTLGEDGADLIQRMQSASSRMKILIESLLSYSRISFNTTQNNFVDLNDITKEVLNDLETTSTEANAVIKISKLYPAKGDPLQLRQLFQNIISNSLKFTKPDLTPQINISSKLVYGKNTGMEIRKTDEEKRFQLIEIKDNGIGFEQEYADKIFQLFERLHGRSEFPGSGMGLSIVQKIVNNHNGYISAKGVEGEGATFYILLPQ